MQNNNLVEFAENKLIYFFLYEFLKYSMYTNTKSLRPKHA